MPCNSLLTVEHILISCVDFDIVLQNFYIGFNLKKISYTLVILYMNNFLYTST